MKYTYDHLGSSELLVIEIAGRNHDHVPRGLGNGEFVGVKQSILVALSPLIVQNQRRTHHLEQYVRKA